MHHRLCLLDKEEQEEETKLLADAYENLIMAYQAARKLNDKMKDLLQDHFNTLVL